MARKRASMREGPLAELFRATEAAQRAKDSKPGEESPAEDEQQTLVTPTEAKAKSPEPDRREEAALERTVEHVYDFGSEETLELKATDEPAAEPQAPETTVDEPEEPETPHVARPRLEAVPPLEEEEEEEPAESLRAVVARLGEDDGCT